MIKFKLKHISFKIKGESHSNQIKITANGFKKGTVFDDEFIKSELKRRNPGFFYNSQRKELDEYEIKGVKNNKIVTKLTATFKNEHINTGAYDKNRGFLRPSHSDYAQYLKYGEIKSGAGEFGGRITLPLTFVGAIAKNALKSLGMNIYTKIYNIGSFVDKTITDEKIKELDAFLPVVDKNDAEKYLKSIIDSKETVGGTIRIVVFNPCKGLGSSSVNGLESKISNLLFSIPSVKGVSFGDGFDISNKLGSTVLDEFYLDKQKIRTKSNHNGGILGGVSTGEPIVVNVAFKPIPTIGKEIQSLNINTMKEEKIVFGGKHDVFAVNRAIPCAEGLVALALLDEMYEKN